jgi:hypothetical protein
MASTSCTTPFQEPIQGNGSHTYYVAAIDAAGNVDASPASRTLTQTVTDTVAPSAPTNVVVPTTTTTSGTVTWGTATDNIGVAGYNVYKNGAWYQWVPPTQFTFTIPSLTCATAYTTQVVSLDVASNYAASPNVPFTTKPC